MEDKTMMQCWEDLANAVVLRAAEDYGLACRALRRNPYDRRNMKRKRSLERFFRSRFFHEPPEFPHRRPDLRAAFVKQQLQRIQQAEDPVFKLIQF